MILQSNSHDPNATISIFFILLFNVGTCQVQTMPEEFENGGLTLQTHQLLSVHTTPEKVGNAASSGYFEFVFE